MIYVGLDDTDMPNTPGTNQLARALALRLAGRYRCALIVRHQLLDDPRVPCTSKNSAASLLLTPQNGGTAGALGNRIREVLRERFLEGSDPGFCIATSVPEAIATYGRRCQQDLVCQEDARRLARRHGIHLEGCGGTEDGVIGALAAVGLVAEGNDGRVVQIGDWPDDLSGFQQLGALWDRGVEVRCLETQARVDTGTVDVGKHLRPNYRRGRVVLFAHPQPEDRSGSKRWRAVRLT
ncbi:MAG: ABC transporter substrate-binding protein [Planctomycetota bacterium]